ANLGDHLGNGPLRLRIHVKAVRGVFQESHLGAMLAADLRDAFEHFLLAASGWRPVRVIADDREDHHAIMLAERLQEDAGYAKDAVVVMGADREKSLVHWSNPEFGFHGTEGVEGELQVVARVVG